jgi:hypothetical protein
MTSKDLKELKLRIGNHYLQEAQIMVDMIESNLPKTESEELQYFMLYSPYAKLVDWIHQKTHENNDNLT